MQQHKLVWNLRESRIDHHVHGNLRLVHLHQVVSAVLRGIKEHQGALAVRIVQGFTNLLPLHAETATTCRSFVVGYRDLEGFTQQRLDDHLVCAAVTTSSSTVTAGVNARLFEHHGRLPQF